MENKAKIVWIDDEYQSLEGIGIQFDNAGISYEGFEDAMGGIEYIKREYEEVDAIIIDGNFFINVEDADIDTKGKALSLVLDSLKEIRHKKEIPFYVLSGMMNFRNREAAILEYKDISKVFDKLKNSDITDLCNKILFDATSNPRRQVINTYQHIFTAIEPIENLAKHRERIIDILIDLKDEKVDFTALRMVFESLFVCLSDLKIIPEGFSNEKGWINGASLFLSRKHDGYVFLEEIAHPVITETLYRVLQITQDGSHNEGMLSLRVDDYFKINSRTYLHHSIVFGFLDVIRYFGMYIQKNKNREINQGRWMKKVVLTVLSNADWRKGKVQRIADNKWGTFICDEKNDSISIHPDTMERYDLKITQNIQVRVEPSSDGRKLHIKEVKIASDS